MHQLTLKKLGIDTYKEAVLYLHEHCKICRSEGLEAQARVQVTLKERSIIATLHIVSTNIIGCDEAGLSQYAWEKLGAKEGEKIKITHAKNVESFRNVRSKIYGNKLSSTEITSIIHDIIAGRYSDIQISSFLTACAGGHLSRTEIENLTNAMVNAGTRLFWTQEQIVDKHCIGGIPGNRTSPIVVAIVAAYGLTIPKASSRAITSPAGTADTMEVLTDVELDIKTMRKVVEKEQGCLVWGGSVSLSPADDMLIRVERSLNLDSEGQLVASVLSKKIAAGSSHILIDIPHGPATKVRSEKNLQQLKETFCGIGKNLGLSVKIFSREESEPIGYGVGPALEAQDVLDVLCIKNNAPSDLRNRSLLIAGKILEFSPNIKEGDGIKIATEILDSGRAWKKFQAICEAQGGMRSIPKPAQTLPLFINKTGIISAIDNRRIALLAKLTGAPRDKTAGVSVLKKIGEKIDPKTPIMILHAEAPGEIEYALEYFQNEDGIIKVE